VADFNRDGRSDLAVLHLNGPVALLRNEFAGPARSLSLRLIGRAGNRDAIGARVELRIGDRTLVRFCQGSQGYLSTDERLVRFGLSEASQVDAVTVRWPSGKEETWGELSAGQMPAGQTRTLWEGTGVAN
jgi:hypothetical protein